MPKVKVSKVMTESEAIARFVADGDVVYVGYTVVAYGLCHEVIRQKKRNLDLVGASQVTQGAYLFLEGCANRTRTAYIGGVMVGGGRSKLMAEMLQQGRIQYEEYTNQTLTLMFLAGALGIPFIPTRSLLGTDFLMDKVINHPKGFLKEKKYMLSECPFSGEKVVLLPALRPDVAIYSAQRADEEGNVQSWGPGADAKWALWAAKKVIISVEEIVPTEVIRSDPNRTLIPSNMVSAVVEMPFGAHPAGMIGYYGRDYAFSALESAAQFDAEVYRKFVAEWIYGVKDRREYLEHYIAKFGYQRYRSLLARPSRYPIMPADYSLPPRAK